MTKKQVLLTAFLTILICSISGFAFAQTEVTIRDLNTYENLQSIDQISSHPLREVPVRFTAIVVSHPRTSGLATYNSTETPSIGRIHIFVTDTTALNDPNGRDGMSMQIVQGSNTAAFSEVENLNRGDIVTLDGELSFFDNQAQFIVTNIVSNLGNAKSTFDGVQKYAPLLDPINVTPKDFHFFTGPKEIDLDLEAYQRLQGTYVKVTGGNMANYSGNAVDGVIERPLYTVNKDGSLVAVRDIGLRYRNDWADERGGYKEGYNYIRVQEDGYFERPPLGSAVNISGFLALGDFTSGITYANGAGFKIAPMEDGILWLEDTSTGNVTRLESGVSDGGSFVWPDDFQVLTVAPTLTNLSLIPDTLETEIYNYDDVTISVDALLAEVEYTLESVQIEYSINNPNENVDEVFVAEMTNTTGDTYSYVIPAQESLTTVNFEIIARSTNSEGIEAFARQSGSYQVSERPPEDFTLDLNLNLNGYSQIATIGADSRATDGFDSDYDIPAPPVPAGDYIRGVFKYPEWDNGLGEDFISDIRSQSDISAVPTQWSLVVTSPVVGTASLNVERPTNFTYPIAVYNGEEWTVSRQGDLLIEFEHDGSKVWEFIIEVGDTKAPELAIGNIFEGPAIWSNSIQRSFNWQVVEDNFLEEIILEHSSDGGVTWDSLYVGLGNQYDWMPSNVTFNEDNYFRISAYDRVNNLSKYTTQTPITIVSETQPLDFEQGWNLIGAPFQTLNAESQITSNSYRFTWDDTTYVQASDYSPGKGYWLGAQGAGVDSLKGVIVEQDIELEVGQGWSMISSQLMRTVYVDSILVTNLQVSETLTYPEAVSQGWLELPQQYLNSAYNAVTELNPFLGYWVGVNIESGILSLPIHMYRQEVGKTLPQGEQLLANSKSENVLEFSVSGESFQQNVLIGEDQLRDIPTPPSAPNSPRIGLVGPSSILGDIYLQLGEEVNESKTIKLFRSESDSDILIKWGDQNWLGYTANLRLENGEQVNLLKQGQITVRIDETMPVIELQSLATSVDETGNVMPTKISLNQNYPNPFNPSTVIEYGLPEAGIVSLNVYNMLGQRVATLAGEYKSAGWHEVTFDASGLSSGMYMYRIQSGNVIQTKKMTLIK